MKIILKHILKNMYEKKLRTLIILLTILLSTMVLFVGLSLNEILNQTYATMAKGVYGDADIVITKQADQDNPFYQAEDIKLKDLKLTNRLDMLQVRGLSEIDGNQVRISLIGLDVDAGTDLKVIEPIEQSNDLTLHNQEAIISARIAEKYDLSIGDQLHVNINDHPYTFKVGAISKSTGLYYGEMDDILLVVNHQQVSDLFSGENLVTQTLLQADQAAVDEIFTILTEENSHFSIQKVSDVNAMSRDEETFQTAMIIAVVIIVLISAYVILSLAKVIVSERTPTIGTLRSVGASKRMINRILRLEFLVYGIFGSILGIALSVLFLPFAADQFNEYKDYGLETVVDYNFVYLLVAFIFGSVFPVVIGMFHIHRANKKPLKDLILNTTLTRHEHSKAAFVIGGLMFIAALILHVLNTRDDLILASGAVLSLFISIVLLMPWILNGLSRCVSLLINRLPQGEVKLGVKNIANNKYVINNTSMIVIVFLLLLMIGVTSTGLDQYISRSLKQDFDVFVGDYNLDFSHFEDIGTIKGVEEVYFQHIGATKYDIRGDRDIFIVYGIEDIEAFDRFYSGATFFDHAKENFISNKSGMIIDDYQAERYQLEVGDKILLEPLDETFNPVEEDLMLELEVVGTMDSTSLSTNRDIVIVPLDFFQAHFVEAFNQIEIKVSDGVSANDVKERIQREYPSTDLQVLTFEELISSQAESVDTLIHGVLFIILLGLVIGLLGVTNNLLVSFGERKQEYAILYSVCMSRRQLISMHFFEMLMTFTSVVVIGFVGGFIMNMVFERLLYAVGLKIAFQFNYQLFFILVGAVFILLLFSTLSLVRKVRQLNVLQELRYE